MNDPLVDVCIPTHHAPHLLAEAIASVRAQTHTAWRLLVGVDGDPGADSLDELAHLADAAGATVLTGRVGAAANMTRLLEAGAAPYAILLHDDDHWLPGALERRVLFLERHPHAGFATSTPVHVGSDGRPLRRRRPRLTEGVHARQELVPLVAQRHTFHQSATLIRRTTLERAGTALDDRFPRLFDWEHAMRLVLAAPGGYVDEPDVFYRRHPAQMSVDRRDRVDEFDSLQDHLDRLVRERAPEIRLDPAARRHTRARGYVGCALDAVAGGSAESPLPLVARAVRTSPRIVFDPGTAAAVVGALGGNRVARHISRARRRSRSRGWRRPA